MNIKLSPQRRDDTLEVRKKGDRLTLNGEDFDFSFMQVGDTLPRSAVSSVWVAGDVHKDATGLQITLFLPVTNLPSLEQLYPVDLLNVPDGLVVLPQPEPESAPIEAPE